MSASSSDSDSESDDEAQAALELQTLETKLSTRSSEATVQFAGRNSVVGGLQGRIIQDEIMKLESQKSKSRVYDFDQDTMFMSTEKSKKKRIQQSPDTSDSRAFPIEIIELKVSYVGENIALVSLKCRKRDTMVKICEVFESLKLNVVTANITAFPETLFKILFIQSVYVDDSMDDIGEIPLLLEWNHEFQFYWNGKTNSNSVGITCVDA
ncbi:unnamed protein product [Lactuca saligna]|uniref:Plant bHLH transcription factor ACT-like domain-containing protein n=1 Tax=Lactuca saligna TaxID=75948 RepID=A0AA35YKT4_LACSI|nr:unnamed protein product [Lactuca saligna]